MPLPPKPALRDWRIVRPPAGPPAEDQLHLFRPRELCALLWASALGAPGSLRLLRAFARLLEKGMSLELFSPHDLSVLVWCCGKVRLGGGRTARHRRQRPGALTALTGMGLA